jgi:DNA-binding NarL/FixJ family response regulator
VRATYTAPQRDCTTCGKSFLPVESDKERICGICRRAKLPEHKMRKVRICLECNSTDCEHLRKPRALTPQEARCLVLVSRGLLNKEIAYELDLTEGTVKIYNCQAYRKLGVHTRVAAALWARDHADLLNQALGIPTVSIAPLPPAP